MICCCSASLRLSRPSRPGKSTTYISFEFYPSPHAEYNGHGECLHERVPGVYGVEHPGHLLMKDGAHQKHGLKPNPHPESKPQRTLPVAHPKTHDKVREHKRDDFSPCRANCPSLPP